MKLEKIGNELFFSPNPDKLEAPFLKKCYFVQ